MTLHTTAPKVPLIRVAALDRDSSRCTASTAACVAGSAWGIDSDGFTVGDCITCAQPVYVSAARAASPVRRRSFIERLVAAFIEGVAA